LIASLLQVPKKNPDSRLGFIPGRRNIKAAYSLIKNTYLLADQNCGTDSSLIS
jgi:hypothetical protein